MNDDYNNENQSNQENYADNENQQKENVNSSEYHYTTPLYSNENGTDNNQYNTGYANQNGYTQNSGNNQNYNSYYSQNNANSSGQTNGNYQGYERPSYAPGNAQYYGNRQSTNGPYSPMNKNNGTGKKVFIGIVVAVAVISIIVLLLSAILSAKPSSNKEQEKVTENVNSIEIENSDKESSDAIQVFKSVKNTNVGILVYKNNSLFTEGSGVLTKEDNDGVYTYIITCAHVISDGSSFVVQTADNKKFEATVVGFDTRTDIGVLKIKAKGLNLAKFGDSKNLQVGQKVYAIGNPGGSEFSGSFTDGMISAIDRPISSSTGYEMECIQHNAAINPGNSGGALVNSKGEVIGINSMKIASASYEGMGFSVPTDVVIDVFDNIVKNGYVAGRPKLGISYAPASEYQSYGMYVTVKALPSGTIIITSITDDSTLKNTDAKVGDLIVGVNGKKMTENGVLADLIEDMKVGDKLTLNLVRVDTTNWTQTEFNVTATLIEDKGNTTVKNELPDSDSSKNPNDSDIPDSYEDFFEEFFKRYGF